MKGPAARQVPWQLPARRALQSWALPLVAVLILLARWTHPPSESEPQAPAAAPKQPFEPGPLLHSADSAPDTSSLTGSGSAMRAEVRQKWAALLGGRTTANTIKTRSQDACELRAHTQWCSATATDASSLSERLLEGSPVVNPLTCPPFRPQDPLHVHLELAKLACANNQTSDAVEAELRSCQTAFKHLKIGSRLDEPERAAAGPVHFFIMTPINATTLPGPREQQQLLCGINAAVQHARNGGRRVFVHVWDRGFFVRRFPWAQLQHVQVRAIRPFFYASVEGTKLATWFRVASRQYNGQIPDPELLLAFQLGVLWRYGGHVLSLDTVAVQPLERLPARVLFRRAVADPGFTNRAFGFERQDPFLAAAMAEYASGLDAMPPADNIATLLHRTFLKRCMRTSPAPGDCASIAVQPAVRAEGLPEARHHLYRVPWARGCATYRWLLEASFSLWVPSGLSASDLEGSLLERILAEHCGSMGILSG